MKIILLMFALTLLLAAPLGAAGLIISTSGTVHLQRKNSYSWVEVRKGQKIYVGDRLKCLKQSHAQVLFNGMLRNLPEQSELILREEPIDLNKFISGLKLKKRVLPAIRDDVSHRHWLRLVGNNRIISDDIDIALDLIELYASQKLYSRMTSLLIKLNDSWPELNFQPILDEAEQRFRNPARWTILKYERGERTPVAANMLADGDLFQIGYRTDDETYLYLFATDQDDSTLIYPKQDDGHLSPGTLLLIPDREAIVAQDNTIFWILSCYGPVHIDKKFFRQVNGTVQNGKPSFTDIERIAPSLCRPTIFFAL